jgi:hypothetical protein
MGGSRWAAVGDSLARILIAQGADVTREYYFNDHGAQIDRFARSLIAAHLGRPTPEDGYGGAYISDIAARVTAAYQHDVTALPEDEAQEVFRSLGVELMFGDIKANLHDFGVDFDVYFHEDSLHESRAVDRAVITHGHSDHARPGHAHVLATAETLAIMRARMGEERAEISEALRDLYDAGTDIITITQYLRPSPRHHPVERWVHPDEFVELKHEAEALGFLGVLSGPLVRSSYRAGRLYAQSMTARGHVIPEHLAHLAAETAGFSQAV